VRGGGWPAQGEVHTWLLPLTCEKRNISQLERLLSPEERVRADRLRTDVARDRFVAGRGALRKTLARYLGCEPAEIGLTAGAFGKPRLAGTAEDEGLCFSLAHAGDLMLIAVTVDSAIGVDLEQLREEVEFRQIAQQFFSRRERDELFSLPHDLQLTAFYRCWTRKEAYLKGCGTGFSQPPDRFDVSLLPDIPPALLEDRTLPANPSPWHLMDIPAPDGYCAAVALAVEIISIRKKG